HKNAGLWMCLFALTSSLKPAFLFLSFPGFREEPLFWPTLFNQAPAERASCPISSSCFSFSV
ncbi:MAG: hypothetical protein CMK80_03200, partial [Pseudomonadales bacterium]|nr:hypothetical protein [Pseudomonadales bacterium]